MKRIKKKNIIKKSKPNTVEHLRRQCIDQSLAQPFDFKENANWRIFRIMAEFVEGFQFLSEIKKGVSFFGSSRFKSNDHHYKEAYELGYRLAKAGFTIVTGGGPGVMEAGNRGAFDAKAESVGLNIQLPLEQRINKYVKKALGFHYFFTRKVMLSAAAQAYVFFPGGYGTLDEFFEIITLIQTKKMERIPVILIGKQYWPPLIAWLEEQVYKKHGAISKKDLKIFKLANNIDEAYKIIVNSKERRYF